MKSKDHMKVSILAFDNCTPMAPVGIMEILNKAGYMHQQLTGASRPFFETELVGLKQRKVKCSGTFNLQCHTTLAEIRKTDILLIPAIEFDIEEKLRLNASAIPHILRLHKKGVQLASMCTGTFLLAATGLLKDKSATTHWYLSSLFRSMFPDVALVDHKVIVDENGLYSSGGATSSLHLGLYLTEKYCGKETATLAQRMLLMDSSNASQTQFSIFIPQTSHTDETIIRAQKLIEKQDGKLTVEQVADQVSLSKRSFIRRFKAATGNTPINYLHRMSVEKAKRQLERTDDSVEKIIYSLGYHDIHSFRKIFMRYTSITPKEYRGKYRV